MHDTQWCCNDFRVALEQDASTPGSSIKVERAMAAGPAVFLWSTRYVQECDAPSLPADLVAGLESLRRKEVPVLFCPYCGAELARFYAGRDDLPFAGT
jgi:hypothetical protein